MTHRDDILNKTGDDCELPAADGSAALPGMAESAAGAVFAGARPGPGARLALKTLGSLSVCLGIAGIVLPLLPTTPFLLLAAACYARSSEKHYNWLLNHKWFGEYIRNYQAGLGVPLRVKLVALAFLWLSIGSTAAFIIDIRWLQILMLCTAAAVSLHMLYLPTCRPECVGSGK